MFLYIRKVLPHHNERDEQAPLMTNEKPRDGSRVNTAAPLRCASGGMPRPMRSGGYMTSSLLGSEVVRDRLGKISRTAEEITGVLED